MILFTAALYAEAVPVIEAYGMKKQEGFHNLYIDEGGRHALLITGSGMLSSYAAVSSCLEHLDVSGLICFGTAASLHGKTGIFRINRILDGTDNRVFYPDQPDASVPEASLITGNLIYTGNLQDILPGKVCMENDLSSYDLYDMESAAVYSIAKKKLHTHAMQFYRVVSDEGITDALTSVDLTDLVRTMVPVLKQACDEMEENTLQKWKEPAEFSMYAERLHCSETMKHELSDLIHYADNAGLDWKNLLNEMAGDIPDRQQGKEVLHAFRSRLCE